MSKVVCFGELLLRLTAPGRELLLQSGRLDVHVGGAEANVAVGLASLGYQAAMVSCVPANPLGNAAEGYLRRHKVATDAVAHADGRMGLYFLACGAGSRPSAIVYDREGSSFALADPGSYAWDRLLDGADLLHLSGVTPALGPAPAAAALAAAEAASAKGVRVSFDGNYRAQLWQRWDSDPKDILGQLVGKADIFFGNHRDISLLLDREFSGDGEERRREGALAALEAFPKLQLIASTARHADDADRHRISARVDTREASHQTDEILIAGIVDRIGTGDAFAVGVLHAVLGGSKLQTAADYGLALACLKHSLPGDASLFGQADIDSFLAGERDVKR
ncbi:MAG: sugar kinase [Pseudomonadota bacterium]|nr:sugar kinase [Pseudomonadota bacterium]